MGADLRSYPAPRERAAAREVPEIQTSALPRTRSVPWALPMGGGVGRSTVTGPRCRGPALIRDISFYTLGHQGSLDLGFELGYARVPVTENKVALATVRPYTLLTELVDPFNQVVDTLRGPVLDPTWPQTFVRWTEPLELIVEELDFYPIIALLDNTALAAGRYHGHLRITEQIDRDALRAFPKRPALVGAELETDPGLRFINLLTGTGPRLPMFEAPPEVEPPHSWYYQRDRPPYDVLHVPTGMEAPSGYHWISANDAAVYQGALNRGVEPHYVAARYGEQGRVGGMSGRTFTTTVLDWAERPGAQLPPSEPTVYRVRRRQLVPRAPREPRAPRVPRPPREPRSRRVPRFSRPPRYPRRSRKPRPRRTYVPPEQRKQKPAKPPGGPTYPCFCLHHKDTGLCAHFGGAIGQRPGGIWRPAGPKNFWVQSRCGYECCRSNCGGPLADVLRFARSLLTPLIGPPEPAWRPDNDPRDYKQQLYRMRAIRRRLKPLPQPPPGTPVPAFSQTQTTGPCSCDHWQGYVFCIGKGWVHCVN